MLLGVYLGALALGGILIGASILFGGHDGDHDAGPEAAHDLDHDLDHDVDHDLEASADAHVDAEHGEAGADASPFALTHASHGMLDKGLDHHPATSAWLPFLSLRFWTFGLVAFGLTGAVLFGLWSATPLTLVFAVPMGLGVGTGASALFRWLQRSATGGPVPAEELRGLEGILLLSAGPGHMGKVRLSVEGQYVDLPATTRDAELLPLKTRVIVVDLKDGVADVTAALPGASTEP
ncbi:MAG: hypothetical protein JXB39_04385 [Deltaproteobacteria bacterium]|nr:hypothetical protein [Deltaproteobacteria bacterium]